MVTDGDSTYSDEHWVIHRIVESLFCAHETNVTLHFNYTGIKNKFLKMG